MADEVLVPEVVGSGSLAKFVSLKVVEEFKTEGDASIKDAELFTVTEALEYEMAIEARRSIRAHIDRIGGVIDPIVAGLHKAHANACDLRNQMKAPYEQADKIYDEKQKVYLRKKREEEERQRAIKLAEDRRLEAESRAKLAVELEKAGESQAAKAVISAPSDEVMPTAPVMTGKVKGSSVKQLWNVSVTSVYELAEFVVKNKLLTYFLNADETALRKYAADTEGKEKIPGVIFTKKDSIAIKKKQ